MSNERDPHRVLFVGLDAEQEAAVRRFIRRGGDAGDVVVVRDRDEAGNILRSKVTFGGSPADALALSSIQQVTFDGHICNDILRTEAGVDVKTFCNLKFSVPIGEEGSPERGSYMVRSQVPIDCWKCKDRSE